MEKTYTPEPTHIKDDFYAVEATDWIPVNRKGEILLEDDTITLGKEPSDYWPYHTFAGMNCHRLMALTFLECPGNPEDFEVNHKDGIKVNNEITNLEWVTRSQNAIHAYKTGLRSDNRPVLAKCLRTGKVQRFYSLQECARHFKVNASLLRNYLRGKRKIPWRHEWTFTYEGTPWSNLSEKDVGKSNGLPRDIISVDEDSGQKIIYPGLTAASRVTGIKRATIGWYLNKLGVNKSNLHKGIRWYYLNEYIGNIEKAKREGAVKENVNVLPHRKPSKVKETKLRTGEIILWDSLWSVADALGKKKNSLEKAILRDKGVVGESRYEYVN